MELVLQPLDSKICGHCCVAMVTGLTAKKAIEIIGHTKATYSKELINAIQTAGIKVADSTKRITKNTKLPETAILNTRPKSKTKGFYGHWIVYHKGQVLCPSNGIYESLESFFSQEQHLKPSSFLEINP